MATLEKIRSRAALLIGVIAFALFAFIVGDFLKSPQGGASQGVIIKVNGNKVYVNDYQARLEEMNEVYKVNSGTNAIDENTSNQITNQVYESILRENILFPQFAEVGLSVSKDELDDRILGSNVDPIIRQMFTDPNTGQYNSSMVLNYLKSVNQDENSARKTHWLFYERLVKENRLNTKYNNLLSKGLVVTPKAAALAVPGVSENKTVEFFSKPYSYIADSLVKVSESEVKAYYNEHLENYKQEESRQLEYISFPIKASDADFKAVENWINDEKAEFEALSTKKDIGNYVKLNSDVAWNENYLSEEAVEARYKEFAFNNEVGSVYGAFLENDTYKITKLVSRELRSDSVKASHILIGGNDPAAANALADSLLGVVKNQPKLFADVAKEYSQDPGSATQGGDLGYFKEGQMVKPFSDACFNGNKGDIVKVASQFGIHIIQITEKGKPVEKVFPDIARYLNWRYASCRDSMEVITFHEQLEFKTGKKDFQTSLVPLIRGNKVMSIIGLSLIGLNFLFDLMMFASDGRITYDEGGAVHLISGLIMIAFSIVFLVQCIWFSRGGLKKLNAELIDDDFI